MQGDGNLVLTQGGTVLFSTRTEGNPDARAVMQDDGNLVVYRGGAPLWASSTDGFPGARTVLQDDGNLVTYHEGHAVWSYRSGYIGDALAPGTSLRRGAYLRSRDRRFQLAMQADGNLVLYQVGVAARWDAKTTGAGQQAAMQADGNFVVYQGASPRFASVTNDFPGAYITVQDDGNLVIYQAGKPIWAYGSGYMGDRLIPGTALGTNAYLRSADRRYQLLMQADGNLVIYGPSGAAWNSGTAGASGATATMQADGNFVIYQGGTALRHTGTGGLSGSFLTLQNDANLVVYNGGQAPWDRFFKPLLTPGGGAPSPADNAAARAASWAASQVGQRTAPLSIIGSFSDWAPGPSGEWSGDCAKFAYSAWYFGAGVAIARGDAKVQYRAYASRIQQGTPPAGALVFWPNLSSAGHIAIADGSGGVYSTQGLDGYNQPIAHVPATAFGTPAGWALP